MNIDLGEVIVEPVEDGGRAFHSSLELVLQRIAPLTAATPGLALEDQLRRLGEGVNVVLASLEEFTGVVDTHLLPSMIERVAELAVTGDGIEVQIGVAGDLRVDKRHRLVIDEALASFIRLPTAVRPAAVREGIATLRRLLALLLLHGWTDDIGDDVDARQAARRAIVDTVQGRTFAVRLAL